MIAGIVLFLVVIVLIYVAAFYSNYREVTPQQYIVQAIIGRLAESILYSCILMMVAKRNPSRNSSLVTDSNSGSSQMLKTHQSEKN